MTALPLRASTFCNPLPLETTMLHIPATPVAAGNGCRIGRVRPAPARPAPLALRAPGRGKGTGNGRDGLVAAQPRREAVGPAVLAQALALLRGLAKRIR